MKQMALELAEPGWTHIYCRNCCPEGCPPLGHRDSSWSESSTSITGVCPLRILLAAARTGHIKPEWTIDETGGGMKMGQTSHRARVSTTTNCYPSAHICSSDPGAESDCFTNPGGWMHLRSLPLKARIPTSPPDLLSRIENFVRVTNEIRIALGSLLQFTY